MILFYPAQYEGRKNERGVFHPAAAPIRGQFVIEYLITEEKLKRWCWPTATTSISAPSPHRQSRGHGAPR
ncbi:MAG: hypothetical protein KGL35_13825 [Bradyrhizobium sp.]|nr:hypothetical protein [Bradyrhizobium sp.]